MPQAEPNEPFEYAKSLYANVIDWYRDAHGRAQSVLTLDGAFVTLLASVIVLKSEDVSKVTQNFGLDTKIALIAMAILFAFSGGFAVAALLPLGLRESAIRKGYDRLRVADGTTPAPSVMWWSQHIHQMPRTAFIKEAHQMTSMLHERALTSQIHTLSRRLAYKYRFVFGAFVSAALAILAFSTASYVMHVG